MGKCVLITGAVRNAGLGMARKFLTEGLLLDDHVPYLTTDTRWGHTARSNAFGYLRGMLKVLQLQEEN